jgi:hypothetical protein
VRLDQGQGVRRTARPWVAGIVVVVLVGLGVGVARQVDAALGLSFRPADVPTENLVAAPPREVVAVPPVTEIVTPDDKRVHLAAEAVAAAVSGRGAPRPAGR